MGEENVAIKPSQKYPALLLSTPRRQQATPAQTQHSQEDIRRFLIPKNQLQPQPIVEAPPQPIDRPPPTAANDIRRYFQPEPSTTNRWALENHKMEETNNYKFILISNADVIKT